MPSTTIKSTKSGGNANLVIILAVVTVVAGVAYYLFSMSNATSISTTNAMTTTAAPANSVSGKFVKVFRKDGMLINFAELRVFGGADGKTNIVLNKPVTATSVYQSSPTTIYLGSLVTDGNLSNFYSSTTTDTNPSVLIDLGSVQAISSIVLIARVDCCQARSIGLFVSILDANSNVIYTSNAFADAKNAPYSNAGSSTTLQYSISLPSQDVTPLQIAAA